MEKMVSGVGNFYNLVLVIKREKNNDYILMNNLL